MDTGPGKKDHKGKELKILVHFGKRLVTPSN